LELLNKIAQISGFWNPGVSGEAKFTGILLMAKQFSMTKLVHG
jgi:hypothetical protein